MGAERGKVMSPDEIQKAAREKWLKYREQQAEKGKGKGLDSDLSTELYTSPATSGDPDAAAPAVKFTSPVVANGRVYVGGQRAVSVYALR